jgi:hypothetical protein
MIERTANFYRNISRASDALCRDTLKTRRTVCMTQWIMTEKQTTARLWGYDREAARVILLRTEGYTVARIRRQTNNIRKWIYRFTSQLPLGLVACDIFTLLDKHTLT